MNTIPQTVKIKLLTADAVVPKKGSEHASGFDLVSTEDIVLTSHSFKLISTGLSLQMPLDLEAQVRPRSGLAVKHGITVLNSPGTIDADYRGEVKVALINHSEEDFEIKKGMRIAQMVFARVLDISFSVAEELSDTDRGSGGFGSTGTH